MAKPPEIWVLIIDETQYWNENIVAEAGRLIGVYLYDASRIVHICSTRASIEAYYVDTATHHTVSDETYEQILAADIEEVSYFSESLGLAQVIEQGHLLPNGVKAARFRLPGEIDVERLEYDWGDAHEGAMEEALEYARCNSVY